MQNQLRLLNSSLVAASISIVLAAMPANTSPANFGTLTLTRDMTTSDVSVEGYTSGSFSLSAIANRDRANNFCLGYGDSTPDHILVLERQLPRLRLQVDSGGNDTTLIVRGPNNTVRCGDNTDRRNKDASIEDTEWPPGTYYIWIGGFEPGSRYNYTLTVQE